MKRIILPWKGIYTGSLILVNKRFPYREEGSKDLVPVQRISPEGICCEAILLERRAVVLLSELMESIRGWSQIAPVSGWRSYQEQQSIWDQSMAENGREFTKKYVAVPGHSEHETGLAIDLGLKQGEIDFIRPHFPEKGICQTFRRRAAMFGFVERYARGKEHVTGIDYEPWHFRYVGVPHGILMTEQNLALEEYIEFIKQFPYGSRSLVYQKNGLHVGVSFLMAVKDSNTLLEGNGNMPYTVSGNNEDGFIVTEWRGRYGYGKELRRA